MSTVLGRHNACFPSIGRHQPSCISSWIASKIRRVAHLFYHTHRLCHSGIKGSPKCLSTRLTKLPHSRCKLHKASPSKRFAYLSLIRIVVWQGLSLEPSHAIMVWSYYILSYDVLWHPVLFHVSSDLYMQGQRIVYFFRDYTDVWLSLLVLLQI